MEAAHFYSHGHAKSSKLTCYRRELHARIAHIHSEENEQVGKSTTTVDVDLRSDFIADSLTSIHTNIEREKKHETRWSESMDERMRERGHQWELIVI